MNEDIRYVIAMAPAIPAAIGILSYRRMNRLFHPFVYMMILDMVIETASYLFIKFPQYYYWGIIVRNLYMLANLFLYLWLIRRNKYLGRVSRYIITLLSLMIFAANGIFTGSIKITFFYLLGFVSLAMLLISIDILSKQIMALKQEIINNFWLWMSGASIIYNAQALLIFGLYYFVLFNTPNGKTIGEIFTFANAGCYILFAVAMFKVPLKETSAMPD